MFRAEGLREALDTLGAVLEARRAPYALVVVGGGSLLLLGLIERPTQDLDVVALVGGDRYTKLTEVPEALAVAARDVADTLLTHDSSRGFRRELDGLLAHFGTARHGD